MKPKSPLAIRRITLGHTQRELAKLTGISHSVIYQIETGRCDPKTSMVIALAEVLDYAYVEVIDSIQAAWRMRNDVCNKNL